VPDTERPFPARHRWAAALLLGVAGLLVNLAPVQLSPGVDLLFGGIPAILAAAALGPWQGLAASAIAASRTIGLWGHPYAWVIFALEGLAIGWMVRRGRRPLAASAIYWLLAGIPLLLLTYGAILGVRGNTAAVLFLKQPFNGLVNAMVVEALLLVPAIRLGLGIRGRPPVRSAIAAVMAIAGVLPALLFGIWIGRSEWERNLERTRERLTLSARAHAARLEQYVRLHEQEVRSMAQSAERRGDFDAVALQRLVTASHEQFPGFVNVYAADSRGVTVAFHPERGSAGEPLVGLDFSHREYYRQLRETGRTVISDVFRGEQGSQQPLIVIAHPIVVADTMAGFVLGALDLQAFPGPEPPPAEDERMRVADVEGRLVYDSRRAYASGDRPRSLADSADFRAVAASAGAGAVEYERSRGRTPAAREAARMMAGAAQIPSLGWWVWTEQPFAGIQAYVARAYLRLLALLIAVTVAALGISNLLAAIVVRPLLGIRRAATSLAGGDRRARVGTLHPAAPAELAQLGRDFDAMADALAGHTAELEELSEIARALAGTLDPDRVLHQVTEAAARLVHADGCTLALLEDAGEGEPRRARVVAASGRAPHAAGTLLPPGEPLPDGSNGDAVRLEDGGNAAAVPLRVGGETLGVLAAFREAAPFAAEDARLLAAFGGHAAVALRNARLLDEAQAAARARSEFIATMSHELRTPLNAVLGHLEILELEIHGPLTPQQRESLGRIEAASRHLRGLIEEVLSFTRLEAGRVELKVEAVDLCALAAEVAAVIEPLATQKSLEFRLDGCEPHPRVVTDPDKVRQVLINLAGNAVKFTDRGEVRIRVRAHDGGGAELAVVDTGPGIAEEDRQRLFRPFEQLHSGFARPHGGTGLGLYLSVQYARLLGGSLEVESEPGRGSTFALILPMEVEVET
jgi:signal transduction histidine kinase